MYVYMDILHIIHNYCDSTTASYIRRTCRSLSILSPIPRQCKSEVGIEYRVGIILHRVDGPAIINRDGTIEWYTRGYRHRDDGPAIHYANGSKYWYNRGRLHRSCGPAIEHYNGSKEWYFYGRRHRIDSVSRDTVYSKKRYIRNIAHCIHSPAVVNLLGINSQYVNNAIIRKRKPLLSILWNM